MLTTFTPPPSAPVPCPRTPLRIRLWLLTSAFIVYGTTIPFRFEGNLGLVFEKLSRVSLNPLISPDTGRRVSSPDVVQNVLLFVPFGVLAMSSMGRRLPVPRLALAIVTAALLSTGVEALQLFTVDRTTSLADVIANSAGALLGALAWPVVARAITGVSGYAQRHNWTDAPALYPSLFAIILLCVASWEPFDPSLDFGSLRSKLRAFTADPLQMSSWSGGEALQFLRFAAASVVGAFAGHQRGLSAPAVRAAALCVAIAIALEASQIAVESRMPSVGDAIWSSAGAVGGAAAFPAVKRIRRGGLWLICVAAATTVGAVGMYLAPFTLRATHLAAQWLPFFGYYEYTSREVVSHVLQLMLLYMPVGFTGAAVSSPARRSNLIASFFAVLVAAVGLEYGQGWINGRYPDVTDVGVALLGWAIGVWLGETGWAGFARGVTRSSLITLRRTRDSEHFAEFR